MEVLRSGITGLVNNAGRSSQYAAIADVDLEQFDAVIAVHLRAVLAGMKYAARVMAVQGTGSIINVASVNGFRAQKSVAGWVSLRDRSPRKVR